MGFDGWYRFNTSEAYEDATCYQMTPGALWGGLKEKTSIHGVPNVHSARGLVKKLLWVAVTLLGVAVLAINLRDICTLYFSYPVTVRLSMMNKRILPFPAVTVCNMNPFKASALKNSPILGEMAEKRKKRSLEMSEVQRQQDKEEPFVKQMQTNEDLPHHIVKRSIDVTTCDVTSSTFHSVSGLCFGGQDTRADNFNQGSSGCENRGSGVVVIDTLDKWNFLALKVDIILDGLSSSKIEGYWLNMDKERWLQDIRIEGSAFTKWLPGEPKGRDDCTIGRWGGGSSGDLHLWQLEKCNEQQKVLTVCQNIVACPNYMYTYGSDNICFFLLFSELTTKKYADAEQACRLYDPDAYLLEIKSQSQLQFFKDLELFSSATAGASSYLLNLVKNGGTWNWEHSNSGLGGFDNWASGEPGGSGLCAKASISDHTWTAVDCSNAGGDIYIVCMVNDANIASVRTDVGPVIITTTTTTTTTAPTTAAQTTESPTTVAKTTESPTTVAQTTESPTTAAQTTEPPTTAAQTTESPTTAAQTTETPTTAAQTTESPTTAAQTTESPTTAAQTTESPTTAAQTTESPTTAAQTTEPPTTAAQTTESPTTAAQTTESPTTAAQTTESPTTAAQTTESPTTVAHTTESPTTLLITTSHATSEVPTTYLSTTLQEETTSKIPTTARQSTPDESTPQDSTTETVSTTVKQTTTTEYATTVDQQTTLKQPTTQSTTQKPIITTFPTVVVIPTPASVNGSKYDRVQTREDFRKQDQLTEAVADLPDEEKAALGYQPEEFLLDCQYAGNKCNINKDFAYFYNAIHGNCYIFNSGWANHTSGILSYKTGSRYGLHLLLNIGQDDYSDTTGEEAGARVLVHTQARMPFPEDEGVLVQAGKLSSIGIKKVTVERKGGRYGNCTDTYTDDHERSVYEEIYDDVIAYSMTACYKTCYQKNVMDVCGCADPYYPKYGKAFGYRTVKSCDTSNITEDDCKYGVELQYINNELDCSCPSPCNDEIYIASSSSSPWPAQNTEPILMERFGATLANLLKNATSEKIKRNLLKLEIYFEEFNFEHLQEKPAFPDETFFGSLGGVLGLCLGFTLLTLFELVELLVDFIVLGLLYAFKHEQWKRWAQVPLNPNHGGSSEGEEIMTTDLDAEAAGSYQPDSATPPHPEQVDPVSSSGINVAIPSPRPSYYSSPQGTASPRTMVLTSLMDKSANRPSYYNDIA